MGKAISQDGTVIAFDRQGAGDPVILVGGALCDRGIHRELADFLAPHFTVVNYDRRGRGESGDTPPYAVEREIEDIAALIGAAGGRAAVYGISSGGAPRLPARDFRGSSRCAGWESAEIGPGSPMSSPGTRGLYSVDVAPRRSPTRSPTHSATHEEDRGWARPSRRTAQ